MYRAPKTNWKSSDYINVSDYTRIYENQVEIKSLVDALYKPVTIVTLENRTFDSMPTPEYVNGLEENLETLNQASLKYNLGDTKQFEVNQSFIDFVELNRLESGIDRLHSNLANQYTGRNKLAFKLNTKGVAL